MQHGRRLNPWSLAAAAWCVVFGLLSLWAAGGTLGEGQLAVSLQERAEAREAGFVAIVAAMGIVHGRLGSNDRRDDGGAERCCGRIAVTQAARTSHMTDGGED